MKRVLRILVPLVMAVAIVLCIGWYFMQYDTTFTRNLLVHHAQQLQSQGKLDAAIRYYQLAYRNSSDNDEIAIALSQLYRSTGNYTKAEQTLARAIEDGGSVVLYTALSRTFVEQNKLRDAVLLLDKITDPALKAQLDALRPAAPTASAASGTYMQYISVTFTGPGSIYANLHADYPSTETDTYTDPIRLADGETTVFAVSVGEDGLVSPLSVYHYVVGNVVEEVIFADSAFEAAVRAHLGVDGDYVIYTSTLWELKEFTVPAEVATCADLKWMPYLENLTIQGSGFEDLTVLQELTGLHGLSILSSRVRDRDLQIIASLPLLEHLTLQECGISSIAPLTDKVSLTHLDLRGNAIRDISPLGTLPQLLELNLSGNAVINTQAIANLTQLQVLDLSYNSLVSTKDLAPLTNLQWLDVSANDLMKLENLSTLTQLRHFAATHNNLIDVDILSNCTQLETLDVSYNTLLSIDVVARLTQLVALDFSHNEVSYLPKFRTDCALQTINGAYNALTSLNPLSKLENLTHVYMDYADANTGTTASRLTNIDALQYCPALQEVHVYGTKVRNVSKLTSKGILVLYSPQ